MASYIAHVKYSKAKIKLTNHWTKHVLSIYNDLEAHGLSLEFADSLGVLAEKWWFRREPTPGSAYGSPPPLLLPPLAPPHIASHVEVSSQWPSPQETLCVSISHTEGQPLAWRPRVTLGTRSVERTNSGKRPAVGSGMLGKETLGLQVPGRYVFLSPWNSFLPSGEETGEEEPKQPTKARSPARGLSCLRTTLGLSNRITVKKTKKRICVERLDQRLVQLKFFIQVHWYYF